VPRRRNFSAFWVHFGPFWVTSCHLSLSLSLSLDGALIKDIFTRGGALEVRFGMLWARFGDAWDLLWDFLGSGFGACVHETPLNAVVLKKNMLWGVVRLS